LLNSDTFIAAMGFLMLLTVKTSDLNLDDFEGYAVLKSITPFEVGNMLVLPTSERKELIAGEASFEVAASASQKVYEIIFYSSRSLVVANYQFGLPNGFSTITLLEALALLELPPENSVGGSSIYNLLIEQGATFSRTLQFKRDGVLVDPSGWDIRSQIRASYSDSVALATFDITKTSTNVTILLDATQTALLAPNYYRNRDVYKITQSFPHADPSTLPSSAYVWDIEVDEGSVTYRRLEGGVLVTPEVSR
jgi:hypothetical protein